MKHTKLTVIGISLLLFLSGCARGVDVSKCISEDTYGFWGGLWHGIIAPIDLICMIWSDTIAVYSQNNNGGWYALGFCLGSGILSATVSSSKRKNND